MVGTCWLEGGLLMSEKRSWWQDIYTFLRHRIWIVSQIHWSRTGSVGIFPPLSKSLQVITMVGKFPQIQFCSSESGTKSRSCAWEKYKYPPPAPHPHSSRALPTINISTQEKNCPRSSPHSNGVNVKLSPTYPGKIQTQGRKRVKNVIFMDRVGKNVRFLVRVDKLLVLRPE